MTNLSKLNQDRDHQRNAITSRNRKFHDKRRGGDPRYVSRKDLQLQEALRKAGILVLEKEYEIPTDPPQWLDTLVEIDGERWIIDVDPRSKLRGLTKKKRKSLNLKISWCKENGIHLLLVKGSAVEMQAQIELERLKLRGRRNLIDAKERPNRGTR